MLYKKKQRMKEHHSTSPLKWKSQKSNVLLSIFFGIGYGLPMNEINTRWKENRR